MNKDELRQVWLRTQHVMSEPDYMMEDGRHSHDVASEEMEKAADQYNLDNDNK